MVNEDRPVQPKSFGSDGLEAEVTDFVRALEGLQKRVRQGLDRYRSLLRIGADADPFQLRMWLRDIEQIASQGGLPEQARQLVRKADEAASEAVLRFDADLRDECARRNWKVDGQWPQYYVQRVVRIEVRESKGRARVGDRVVSTLHVPTLVRALETELKGLLPQGFDPARFLEALAGAFGRLPSSREHGAPIWLAYRELLLGQQTRAFWRDGRSALFRSFGEQRFRAMLTTLLEEGATKTKDGRQLKLLPPLKAEEAMYIFVPAEQRFAFVGRIDFVSVDPESPL